MPKKMTDSELSAFLGSKINSAMNDEDGDLSQNRQDSLDYYLGQPFGNERDGYSSYVTREVLEAVEWAMPPIIRVFTAGDKVVQFDAINEGDEASADRDTDTINHLLLKENDGFEVSYAWIKDALLQPNGYVKVWVDDAEEVTTEQYGPYPLESLAPILEDSRVEVIEQESEVEMINGQPMELFSIKVKFTETKPKLRYEAVAPEQVLVDNDLITQDMDKADFVAHRVKRTFTWLVNNGYDRDLLESVGTGEDHGWSSERTGRFFFEDEDTNADSNDDESMRQFWVHECYVKVDADGDGLAEGRKIVMIGDTIFENEECDYQPFISMSAILMSHKHTGLSLADLVKDIQLINSTLTRQLLDNVYRLNIRRKYVGEGALVDGGMTIDALTDATSEFIPCRDPNQIIEETVQPIIGEILPVIQKMTDQAQVRSGITPNLSLDPNVLQQSTMGAFSAALEQASERVELITRVFAETGFKRLMRKAHRLCREHMDHDLQFKLGDSWITTNPSDWRDRTTVTVNVGLGFNDKATKIQLLANLLEYQKEALGLGWASYENIHETLTEMVEASGLGDIDKFFIAPDQIQPQQPQPDPAMELVKAQIQNESQKVQLEGQKAQQAAQEALIKVQQESEKALSDRDKWSREMDLRERELDQKSQEMLMKQHQKDQDIETKLIDIQARIEAQEANKNVNEGLSELDQEALKVLRGANV